MLSKERIKTNRLLLDDLDFWDEFTTKSISDDDTEEFFKILDSAINEKLQKTIDWLDTEEARQYFQEDIDYRNEIFESLEEDWDEILSREYDSADELIDNIYEHGKKKGYKNIQEKLRYTNADRYALDFAKNYNFHLIQKLDGNLRGAVHDQILQSRIVGDHPYELASKIEKLGVQPLPGSTLSAQQRAVMIARTETARVQNTGILQSYVNEGYTEVKILTAEDNHVCHLCLANAYEFNTDEIIFENRGKERVHRIADMNRNSWVPLHPNCRCTYIVVAETKETPPKNPMYMDFTPKNGEQGYNGFDGDWSKKSIKKSLKDIVDKDDINSVTDILIDYRRKVKGKDNEYLTITDANFNILSDARTDYKNNHVELPEIDVNAVKKSYFGLAIHNHPSGIPLPHYIDLETGIIKNKVKYNIIYSSNGFTIIRNKHFDTKGPIDESRYKKMEDDYTEAYQERKDYLNRLSTIKKEEFKQSIDINSIPAMQYSKRIKKIDSDVVNSTFKEQIDIFNSHLSKYGFQLKFIKP